MAGGGIAPGDGEVRADGLMMRARGRGARTNRSGRFEALTSAQTDDGWGTLDLDAKLKTHVTDEAARKIITTNGSPDISFDKSINPYRGCEHGCSYCYARPSHAYMGLSAGLDFETRLFAKTNAAQRLRATFENPRYRAQTIAMGTNTDPYQPIERQRRITRDILQVMAEFNHPVAIVTKSALVARDIDILAPMAEKGLVKVALSITTLDPKLARAMEPRASAPQRRLDALAALARAGIPTAVMVAPIIPALNDHEIEKILERAAGAGVSEAAYVLLRLPLEVRDIFAEWLETAYPDKARHVMALVRSMRDGKDYDASWGKRMRGTGPYAWSIGRRFELACARLKLNWRKLDLRCDLFRRPKAPKAQLSLFEEDEDRPDVTFAQAKTGIR